MLSSSVMGWQQDCGGEGASSCCQTPLCLSHGAALQCLSAHAQTDRGRASASLSRRNNMKSLHISRHVLLLWLLHVLLRSHQSQGLIQMSRSPRAPASFLGKQFNMQQKASLCYHTASFKSISPSSITIVATGAAAQGLYLPLSYTPTVFPHSV